MTAAVAPLVPSISVSRTINLLLGAVLLVGLYFPSSLAGEQSEWLWAAPGFVAMGAFATILVVCGAPGPSFLCAGIAAGCLLLFTLTTPLWTLTPGALLPYSVVLILLCADLSKIDFEWPLRASWIVLNIVTVVLAVLIIADYQPVKGFLIENYSAFYSCLVPNMLAAGKPVLTFGSHSIAAFFFSVCYYLHLKSYEAARSKWSFLAAVAYLVLLLFLKSVSAYSLFVGGTGLLVYHTRRHRAILLFLCVLAVAGAAMTGVVTGTEWKSVAADVEKVWAAPESGFPGRYSISGVLATDLEYLAAHPFRGIGIGYSETLWYGDSGPIELLIRGSFPLLLSFYGALWFFLRTSLRSKTTAVVVFVMYLAFEVAYSNLLYLRTACMLPFVVVYLNATRGAAAGD